MFPEYVCIEDVDKIISSVHQENLSQLYSYRQLKISGGNGKGPRPTTARIHAQGHGDALELQFRNLEELPLQVSLVDIINHTSCW